MELHSKVYVAGHNGMVGSAIVRLLSLEGYTNIVTRTRAELNLTRQQDVEDFFAYERPDYVFLAAAKVGCIIANSTYKADFIYENLVIASNVIHSAWKYGCKKLLNLGSSCIYPKFAKQPIKEEYLLTDILEPTNEPYAIAKIAAIKLCWFYNEQYGTNFISAMPSNLYGIGDNFHLTHSHVLPAMIRKFHCAKMGISLNDGVDASDTVYLWGDGTPEREFLYVDDLVEGLLFLMRHVSKEDIGTHVNIGHGSDVTIKKLAQIIQAVIGFEGNIVWDTSKPNGTPKKLMDSSRIHALGWSAKTSLEEGIQKSYEWFCNNIEEVRR